MANRQQPRVALIPTGGTIEAIGHDRLDLAFYLETKQRLQVGELLARVPELADIAVVTEVEQPRLTSHAMTDADIAAIGARAQALLSNDEADAVVITQGTNTIDELAYALHLTLDTARPVVVAGAMRPASGIAHEGELNLLNAVRVAYSPASTGLGVLVVLDDTIHSARDVAKANSVRQNAFRDPDYGPLGYADSDAQVIYGHRPARAHTTATPFGVEDLGRLPRVDVVMTYQGADGALIDAAVGVGARGIVSAGTGSGWPTPGELEALKAAAGSGVVIVQASRTGSGRVPRTPGMAERRWVAAGDLQPWKARVLLRLALTKSSDPDEIQGWFDTY
ncbi:MAG: asparaginase [Chloroflexi bacterium]|nr:asparaginase [Chloroflexota bacterium]